MGRDKALLPWRGRPLVECAVETFGRCAEEVIVVSSAELALPPLDARVVVDREPALGPLSGIRDGLEAASHPLVQVTAVDTPFARDDLIEALWQFGRPVALSIDGHVQPLAAIYPREAHRVAGELLARGERRAHALVSAVPLAIVDASASSPNLRELARGFNTADEYLAALTVAGVRGMIRVRFESRSSREKLPDDFERGPGRVHAILDPLQGALGAVDGGRFDGVIATIDGTRIPWDEHTDPPVGPGESLLLKTD